MLLFLSPSCNLRDSHCIFKASSTLFTNPFSSSFLVMSTVNQVPVLKDLVAANYSNLQVIFLQLFKKKRLIKRFVWILTAFQDL